MYFIIYIYTHIHVLIHMYIYLYIHSIYIYLAFQSLDGGSKDTGPGRQQNTGSCFVVIVGWTCWFPAFQNVQQEYWNSLNLFSDFLWMLVRAYCVSNDPIIIAYCFQSHCSSSPLCFELFVDKICLNLHVCLSSPHMLVGWGCFLPRLSGKNTFFRRAMYLSFMISVYEAFCAAEFHSVVQPSAKRAGRAVFSLGKSQHDSEIPMFSGKKTIMQENCINLPFGDGLYHFFLVILRDGLLLGLPS